MNSDLIRLSSWLCANQISLNTTKTEVILFRSKNKPVPYIMNLHIDGHVLKFSTCVKYLGLFLDEYLAWNFHFDHLSTKLRRSNGILSKLRHFVPQTILKTLYFAIFHSHLTYAITVWGQSLTQNSRVGKLQKRCIRILTISNFDAESAPLFLNLVFQPCHIL